MNALLTIISTGSLIAFAAGLIITATFFDQLRRRFKLAARSRLFYRASDPAIAAAIRLSMADLEKAAAGHLVLADWQISKLIALFNITRSRELIDD